MNPSRNARVGPPNVLARAFTLIELLVVISIISLLVAILLPALASARKTAIGVQCKANQRQLGVAYAVYAGDYDDYIPASATGGYPGASVFSSQLIRSGALGNTDRIDGYAHASIARSWDSSPALRCPGEFSTLEQTGSLMISNTGVPFNRQTCWQYMTSYSMNWYTSQYSYGTPRKGWSLGPGNREFEPSEARILADSPAYNLFYLSSDIEGDLSNPRVAYAYPHVSVTGNGLFMDGHVTAHQHPDESGERIWQQLWLYPSDPP